MQAPERKGRTVRDSAVCALAPERLFDLLADPIERQTWDLCPPYITQEPLQAAPGPALRGPRYSARGTARGIRFVGTTLVMAADRPRRYQTSSEMTFERAYPDAWAVEEYLIEPQGDGSLVRYTMRVATVPGTGAFLFGLLNALLEPFVAPNGAKRNFRNTLRYAEKHAEVSA